MINTKNPSKLMTVSELSDALKLTRTSIQRLRKQGMPVILIGVSVRYDYVEVMQWIKTRQTEFKKLKEKA
jgi:phage terminase Nu1 subunit (DNA packaging protein)